MDFNVTIKDQLRSFLYLYFIFSKKLFCIYFVFNLGNLIIFTRKMISLIKNSINFLETYILVPAY